MDDLQKLRLDSGLDDPQSIVDPKPEEETVIEEEEVEEKTIDNRFEDDEEEEEVDKPSTQKGIPPREFNKIRTQLREEKEAREAMAQELAELKAQKQEVERTVSEEESILTIAKEMLPDDATEEQLRSTQFQLKKILQLTGRSNQSEELKGLQEKIATMEDEKIFNQEWEEFSSEIASNYPGSTSKQLREAKNTMDELAHLPEYADKEFDYVYYKNKDRFAEIFTTRKSKTFDSKDSYIPPEKEEEIAYKENLPIGKKLKLHEKMIEQMREEDERTGWNVMADGKTF